MNVKMILGAIIAITGLFYAAAPHGIHVSSGIGFGAEHIVHMGLGVVLIIVGAVLAYTSKKNGKKK